MNRGVYYGIVLKLQVVIDEVVVISCGLSQLVLEHVLIGACEESEL